MEGEDAMLLVLCYHLFQEHARPEDDDPVGPVFKPEPLSPIHPLQFTHEHLVTRLETLAASGVHGVTLHLKREVVAPRHAVHLIGLLFPFLIQGFEPVGIVGKLSEGGVGHVPDSHQQLLALFVKLDAVCVLGVKLHLAILPHLHDFDIGFGTDEHVALTSPHPIEVEHGFVGGKSAEKLLADGHAPVENLRESRWVVAHLQGNFLLRGSLSLHDKPFHDLFQC